MGGNKINNAKDITASGNQMFDGNMSVNGNTSLKEAININGTTTINASFFVVYMTIKSM